MNNKDKTNMNDEHNSNGCLPEWKLCSVSNKDLARRMAIWVGDKLESYERIKEQHKSRTYQWLVVNCKSGRKFKLTAKNIAPYFLYVSRDEKRRYYPLIRWTDEGIEFEENLMDTNCWILADVFFI